MKTKRVAKECPRCGVLPGQFHAITCPLQQCPYTGRTGRTPAPLDDRLPWTGTRPGVAECREHGLYAKKVGGLRVTCDRHDPGAIPDLRRLRTYGRWDRHEKRYVWIKECSSIMLLWEWSRPNQFTVRVQVESPEGENTEGILPTVYLKHPAADALDRLRFEIERLRKKGWSFSQEILAAAEKDFLDERKINREDNDLGEDEDELGDA